MHSTLSLYFSTAFQTFDEETLDSREKLLDTDEINPESPEMVSTDSPTNFSANDSASSPVLENELVPEEPSVPDIYSQTTEEEKAVQNWSDFIAPHRRTPLAESDRHLIDPYAEEVGFEDSSCEDGQPFALEDLTVTETPKDFGQELLDDLIRQTAELQESTERALEEMSQDAVEGLQTHSPAQYDTPTMQWQLDKLRQEFTGLRAAFLSTQHELHSSLSHQSNEIQIALHRLLALLESPERPDKEQHDTSEQLTAQLSLLRDTLSQSQSSKDEKLDSLNSQIQDAVDFLDTRIDFTNQHLSENHEQSQLSVSQLNEELSLARTNLAQFSEFHSKVAFFFSNQQHASSEIPKQLSEMIAHLASLSGELDSLQDKATRSYVDLQELNHKLLTLLEHQADDSSRTQRDLALRLARIESNLSRNTRKSGRPYENVFFGLVLFLLFTNLFITLWLRFWQ